MPFVQEEHFKLLISRLNLVLLDFPLPEHLPQLTNLYPPHVGQDCACDTFYNRMLSSFDMLICISHLLAQCIVKLMGTSLQMRLLNRILNNFK